MAVHVEVKELAECSICSDLFTDPRMLPCIHTFCLKCLSDTAKNTHLSPGNSMPCPLCRAPFAIPSDGMVGLKKNFFIERLVEIAKVSKPSDNGNFCENCIEDDEKEAYKKQKATHYCIHCRRNICDRCCKDHTKYQELKDHQLVAIGSLLKEELVKKFSTQNCEQHCKEPATHYCLDCQKVVCMACYIEEHDMHKCLNFDKMGDTFLEELNNDLTQLGNLSTEASKKSAYIIEEEKNFRRKVEFAENAILKKREEINLFVDKCTDSLLKELSSIKNLGNKRLEIAKEENEQHKSTVESLELHLMDFISKGSSAEICRKAKLLHGRCESLVKDHIKQNIVSLEVSFDESNSVNLETGVNIVGTVKAEMKTNCEEEQYVVISVDIRTSIELDLSAADARSFVRGVTKLGNEVFVVCSNPRSILIFDDQSPFRFQKKIETKEIVYPFYLAAIEKSKCLFISDDYIQHLSQGNRCIWKVTGDDFQVTKWLDNVDTPYTVSSSPDDYLLVLRQCAPFNRLEIYSEEGTLIQSLLLPAGVQDPFCCIQKTDGEFIISHKDGNTNRWTISRLSNNGQEVIRQFRATDDFGVGSVPPSLFLDIIGDLLFVTDYNHDRVLLLDPNSLQIRHILLSGTNIFPNPLGLFCDSRKKQLFVRYSKRVVANIFD